MYPTRSIELGWVGHLLAYPILYTVNEETHQVDLDAGTVAFVNTLNV
jgi:hypothetical protein